MDRTVNLQNMMMMHNAFRVLSKIIANSYLIAKLNLRENYLKDSVIEEFGQSLVENNSVIELDITQSDISPHGF